MWLLCCCWSSLGASQGEVVLGGTLVCSACRISLDIEILAGVAAIGPGILTKHLTKSKPTTEGTAASAAHHTEHLVRSQLLPLQYN